MDSTSIPRGPVRILFRFRGDDVPGRPEERLLTITESFFSQKMRRGYAEEVDHIHIRGTLLMPRIKSWMLVDCNVKEGFRHQDIPILVYHVTFGDDGEMYFNQVDYRGIRRFLPMFGFEGIISPIEGAVVVQQDGAQIGKLNLLRHVKPHDGNAIKASLEDKASSEDRSPDRQRC